MKETNKHFLLLLSGMVGAGKSTVGELLKRRLARTAVFDMDDIKWQISDFVRGDEDNAIVRDGVRELAHNYCKHGINVIIPQTMRPEEPAQFRSIAEEFGYEYLHVELFADDDVVLDRLMERQKTSEHPSTLKRIKRNIRWYHENPVQDDGLERINTTELDPEALASLIQEKLSCL